MKKQYHKLLALGESELDEFDLVSKTTDTLVGFSEDRGVSATVFLNHDCEEILKEVSDSFRKKLIGPIFDRDEDVFLRKHCKNWRGIKFRIFEDFCLENHFFR